MIIAQITDLHVVARDRLCYRQIPTNAELAEAVAHINSLALRPDVVIASGDLSDHGREDEYEVLREILAALPMPVFLIPGNHDRREALLKVFAAQAYLPPLGSPFIHYAIDDFPIRLIGLDTSVPEHQHGMLCDARLQWLDETLGAQPDRPTMIFMHHPPFRTGIQWMDASGLHGGRKMEEIVARHRNVIRVVAGHIHRPIHLAWAGTIASTAPSTCHQVTLNLAGGDGYEFVMEPRAIQLHVLDPGYDLVTHLSYVPNGYREVQMLGSLPEKDRASLVERAKKDYAEMCRTEFDVPGAGCRRG
jgi:3',5'-cyclic AMP phosphodiesterase CpdA